MSSPQPVKRVLIAEDNPETSGLLRVLIKASPYEVVIAEDGMDAMEAYNAAREDGRPFDLLVLDGALPRMNGYQVAETVRANGDPVAIAFWTADDSPITYSRAASVDAIGVWVKPTANIMDGIREALA